MVRMSAEERREIVIRAAITEFSRSGYHGTSTETIARRVGVSQPYLFRLFPNKQAIFLAAAERCLVDNTRLFAQASEGLSGQAALEAMGAAYVKLIAEDPEMLLMQMQMYVTVAAAEAAGDHSFGESLRDGWTRLYDSIHRTLGGDHAGTKDFLAHGMLINTLVSLGFPPDHRLWVGVKDEPPALPGK
ncbi:TetR/AcrR family transcriptional regulator [Streptomyces liangshanensis]|uniref:TetR/AcrR family transcriptional regulator n=1 Tax=Streptomyces liangshanensis TaxID=2717324 RepID=A0A6G9GYC9_9ACTN|nr:TetR/AcrR family transcriptional regulator [Streptomyces liangshanensis]QIQ03224.1 TetR/AcrR family transcriptional regulator [Streptomyces liangshanensis]